jgi:hypothetical protein
MGGDGMGGDESSTRTRPARTSSSTATTTLTSPPILKTFCASASARRSTCKSNATLRSSPGRSVRGVIHPGWVIARSTIEAVLL